MEEIFNNRTIYNERKLNEFIELINHLKNESLRRTLLYKHVYDDVENENSFIAVKARYNIMKNKEAYFENIFDETKTKNLLFTASYFGHTEIVVDEIKKRKRNINGKFGFELDTPLIMGILNDKL